MKTEEWRDIVGYDGKYQVSNFGNVRRWVGDNAGPNRMRRSQPVAQWKNWNNYHLVSIKYLLKRNHYTVHRLVLEAFVGPRPEGLEAAHMDNNKSNNSIDNLQWVTRKVNHSHKKIHGTSQCGERGGRAKLKDADVIKIRAQYKLGEKQVALASKFGVSQSVISNVIIRKTWTHI